VNNPNEFPLNLHRLTRYAARWAAELPGIKSIRLYGYSSFLAGGISKYKSSVKYAIVFDAKNPEELWHIITDDSGEYLNLIDAAFVDFYIIKPDTNYRNDWTFTISDFAKKNVFSSIMTKEPYWILYPAEEEQAPETSPAVKTVVPKENSLDINASEPLTDEQAEEIIKEMTVIRVSDTEIIIRHGNEEINATCKDMGFKSNAKPWKMFNDILQDRNHQYFIGLYDKVNPDNNQDYGRKIQLLKSFSAKFIEFINGKFSLSLLNNFNVFRNMKHKERAGIYQAKFQIEDAIRKEVFTTKEEVAARISALKKEHDRETDPDKQNQILAKLITIGKQAADKGLITKADMKNLLPEHDDR
jgi:hypothetical protein